MTHEIVIATTGRSKCRGCRQAIAKGELRFGEQVPNAFGEGTATYWFHLPCGAARRPEPFLEALQAQPDLAPAAALREFAELGVGQPRVCEIVGAERSPTGRARCRACRETIDKDALRLALERLQDGMPSAAGFVHAGCASRYLRGENSSQAAEDEAASAGDDIESAQNDPVRAEVPLDALLKRLRQLPNTLNDEDFAELAQQLH